MKAIVPVAGFGTRLRPHTHTSPKVLLPVAGKAMLAHILDELVALAFTEVTFIIGYKGEMIRDYVTQNYSFKANFVEQDEMKGLGHAISLAKPYHYEDEPVFIVLGDTIFEANLKPVFARGESAIGVKKVADARRFGVVELDQRNEVVGLIEKPEVPPTNLAIVGLYYIKNPKLMFDCLDEMIHEERTTKGEYQLTDALQKMLTRGERMRVFMIDGWYDCGKTETMLLTNRDLLDKQLQGAAEYARISNRYPDSVIIMPVAIADNAKLEACIIGPHVTISANTLMKDCIARNSIIGENAEVSNIVIEASIINDNARVVGNTFHLNIGDSSEISLS